MRNAFKLGMCVKIGDGRKSSLFFDKWLEDGRLCDLIDISTWQNFKYVREWISDNHQDILASFARRHPQITQQIQNVRVSSDPDKFIWSGSSTGIYSIESAYDMIRIRLPTVPCGILSVILLLSQNKCLFSGCCLKEG